jgi:quercetin dioxygenase-like cupin family protein
VSAFEDLEGIGPRRIWDGVVVRSVHGERSTLGVVELEPDSHVPEHAHENEQLGMVLKGDVEFRVGDERMRLGPGGTWCIAANVPHEVWTGPDGAVVIDVFAPGRDDWRAVEQGEPQPPLWP